MQLMFSFKFVLHLKVLLILNKPLKEEVYTRYIPFAKRKG